MNTSIRLDKYLANQGFASRRKIEEFLRENRVEINKNRVTEPGERLDPQSDVLTINNKLVNAEEKVYFVVNKPVGFITSVVDEAGHQSVVSLLKGVSQRVFPVGRLDVESHGLVLLTNDGELTYRLTHPKFQVPKTYKATIQGRINHKQLTLLKSGVRLKDGKTAPAKVKIESKSETTTRFLITITEGRNRQIRRMCKAINLHLIDLQRIEFADIKLDGLELGEFRQLDDKDLKIIEV